MASTGTVYYDVLPNLDGFAAKVASGLGNAKPIKIPVEVDSAKAAASLKQVSSQTDNLGKSSTRLAAAQGRVRVTAAQLNETRQKATAGSAKLIQAEERYAAALRGVKTAQDQDAKVAARAVAVREKAAAASQRAAAKDAAARKQVIQQAGTGLAVGGAAALVALGGIVKVTADFDQAVSNVAATGKDARANLSQLREEAIRYGASTSFSAKEAANAQEELIKANVSVTDTINGGLKGALDLAAAGSLGVADAAGIMGTALSQFKLDGTQAGHVADLLAAGAGKAQGEVQDFAEALKYVGPNAQAAGVGIEETVGVLAQFANQGILGSQAGTSLRSMLVSLTAPVGTGAKALAKYGIETRNAAGEFVGFEAIAGELQQRLGKLGQAERDAALARIFGKNSLTAATVLYEGGAAGVKQWTDAVNESGFASDVANTKMNNLKGDLEQLSGAFQSAFIETASGSQGGLRSITQAATGLIEITSKIPDGLKSVGFIGAGLLAATAVGAGGIIKLRGAVSSLTDAFGTLGISSKRALIATGGIGIGIAAAAAVLGHFAIKSAEAKARTDDLTSALLTSKGAIDGNVASMRAKSLEDTGALKAAQDLGISIQDITQASLGNASAQDRVSEALKRAQAAGDTTANSAAAVSSSYNENAKSIALVNDAVAGGNRELQNATEAQKRQAAAADAAAGSNKRLGDSLATQQGAARDALAGLDGLSGKPSDLGTDEVNALTTALWGNATAALAAVDAELAYEEALDQVQAAAKEGKGKGLDTSKDDGQANVRALRNYAAASQAVIDSNIKQGKSASDVGKVTREARSSFIESARAMGASKKEAGELADRYGLIPKRVETKVEASISAAKQAQIAKFETSIKGLPKSVQTEVRTLVKAGKFDEAKAKVKAYERSLKSIPGNVNVDAKVKPVGVPATKAAIVSIKGKNATIKVSPNGIPPTKSQIQSIKGKNVTIQVQQNGVGSVRSQINAIQGKTVFVRVKKEEANAVGGVIGWSKGLPGYATGGVVRGRGGPKEDNIAMLDRATGVQTAWGSVGEMLVNAAQTKKNKEALQAINAGGTWDVVPRYAEGGAIGSTGAPRSVARSLTLNLDLGPVFGGVQRMVIDLMDDRDEYSASIGRMR